MKMSKVTFLSLFLALTVPLLCLPLNCAAQDKPYLNPSAPQSPLEVGDYFHGDLLTMVFHRSVCGEYDCENCKASFQNREEAQRAGYKPCEICKP